MDKGKLGVEIKFPIIADGTGEIAKKFGMIHPGKVVDSKFFSIS
jgi:peroxiredoxin (alkyl hydroperoxide reductase subunit C)